MGFSFCQLLVDKLRANRGRKSAKTFTKNLQIPRFSPKFVKYGANMSSRNFITKILVLFAALATGAYAAETAAKVHFVNGTVEKKSEKKPEWKGVRIGNKIFMADHLRADWESEATMSLPDGSMATLTEHTEIQLSQLLNEDGSFQTGIDIVTGRLVFSAQKQSKNSSFKFKTGTMAAAIRGTDGCIDGGDKITLVGLRNGALQVELFTGEKVMIQGGQVAFKVDSLIVLNLASAGDPEFHKAIAKLLSESNMSHQELIENIQQKDSIYQHTLSEARKSVECNIDALPDTVTTEDITIHGRCTADSKANFYGNPLVLEKEGQFLTAITLDSSAVGEKLFRVSCNYGGVEFYCGEAKTFYRPMEAKARSLVAVTSASPATVCEEGLVVEGTYQTPDTNATLTLSIGNSYRSANLVKIPDGKPHPFQQIVAMSDRNGLWNETMALLEFDSEGKKVLKEIPIRVNRTCQAVNQNPPMVRMISYDSLSCAANVSIDNFQDDLGTFKVNVDNVDGRNTIVQKNFTTKVKLNKGIHEYEFVAEDQAGNVASQTKTLGCFPNKFFNIRMDGSKSHEVLWYPYPNPGSKTDVGWKIIKKTLRFSINLDDVSEVYSVTVKQNGRNILHETLNQIESLDYDIPVDLVRGKVTKFEVIVKHKSGRVATATKNYEVK